MKLPIVAVLPLLALATSAHAYPVVSYSSNLPSASQIIAPTPDFASGGIFTTVSPGDPPGATYVGLTKTYDGIARSPFEGVAGYENVAYDAVTGGGFACFGFCGLSAARTLSVAANPSGSPFSFIYGSPDTYNNLTLYTNTGTYNFSGSDLTDPNTPSQMGYEFVTITGAGNIYGVKVESDQNSFEFAAVLPGTVPLPASAPMFGAALVVLGAVGYGVKRRAKAVAAA